MLPSRKSWSFTILFYSDFAKSWSQRQKVGVKYSKFGVNENSAHSCLSETVSVPYRGLLICICEHERPWRYCADLQDHFG